MSKQSKPSPPTNRRDQAVNFPTSDVPQDVSLDYEYAQADGMDVDGNEGTPLLDLKKSLVALQALRQTRQHHLNKLFPIFTSPIPKPKPVPKQRTKNKPDNNITEGSGLTPEPRPDPAQEAEEDPLPPHQLRLLGTCRMALGPITIDQVNLWECRWEVPQATLPPPPSRSLPQHSTTGSSASTPVNPLTVGSSSSTPVRPSAVGSSSSTPVRPSTMGSSSSMPAKPVTPAGPSRSTSVGTGSPSQSLTQDQKPRPPGQTTMGPHGPIAPPPAITRELIDLVNARARAHPWLAILLDRAETKKATYSELKKLGGVVEILDKGYDLPLDRALAERAAGDVMGYIRSGAKKRPGVGTGRLVMPAIAPKAAPASPSMVYTPSKTGSVPGKPAPLIPDYPLILISFAENPAVKFVLPFPFAYISYHPTESTPPVPSILPVTLPPPPVLSRGTGTPTTTPMVRSVPGRRGHMLLSTFLPSKGWGRWFPENEATSESARKRSRRKDPSAHARLGLPKEDRDYSIGGCTIPAGGVEPLTIRFEDMAEVTWMGVNAVGREVEVCLEARRKRLEKEKEKEAERNKKTAEKQKEVQVPVQAEVGKEGEKKSDAIEIEKSGGDTDGDDDMIVIQKPDPANKQSDTAGNDKGEVDDMIVIQRPEATNNGEVTPANTKVSESTPTDKAEATDSAGLSSERPKRDSKKKKRWSDGEEDILPNKSFKSGKSTAKQAEFEEEVGVEGDDLNKSFKARIFNQLLKRVPARQYLRLRLPEPLPDDLVKASTHLSDPVIKNLAVGKASQTINILPVQNKKRRTLASKRNFATSSAKKIKPNGTKTGLTTARNDVAAAESTVASHG